MGDRLPALQAQVQRRKMVQQTGGEVTSNLFTSNLVTSNLVTSILVTSILLLETLVGVSDTLLL